jgi:hypothetical protein
MTKPKTIIMKLLLLIILLCGINSAPHQTAKAKKDGVPHQKATTNFDMVPSGLLFQF